jgi:putative DNA primase/helicase
MSIDIDITDTPPPEASEDAIALTVVDRHHHELRYVAEFGRWFMWDGCHWAEDQTKAILALIRHYVRGAALTLPTKAQQRSVARHAVISGVERYVRADQRVAAEAKDFDPGGSMSEAIGPAVSRHRRRRGRIQ